MILIRVTHDPIDPESLLQQVTSEQCGATSLFLGTVRDRSQGRAVAGVEYSAYEAMAEREIRRIAEEAISRFDVARLAIEHRVGELALGDVSVAIAVAHEHRAPTFDACRYVIEELKKRVPIWKLELYADGTRDWVDPTRRVTEVAS